MFSENARDAETVSSRHNERTGTKFPCRQIATQIGEKILFCAGGTFTIHQNAQHEHTYAYLLPQDKNRCHPTTRRCVSICISHISLSSTSTSSLRAHEASCGLLRSQHSTDSNRLPSEVSNRLFVVLWWRSATRQITIDCLFIQSTVVLVLSLKLLGDYRETLANTRETELPASSYSKKELSILALWEGSHHIIGQEWKAGLNLK